MCTSFLCYCLFLIAGSGNKIVAPGVVGVEPVLLTAHMAGGIPMRDIPFIVTILRTDGVPLADGARKVDSPLPEGIPGGARSLVAVSGAALSDSADASDAG